MSRGHDLFLKAMLPVLIQLVLIYLPATYAALDAVPGVKIVKEPCYDPSSQFIKTEIEINVPQEYLQKRNALIRINAGNHIWKYGSEIGSASIEYVSTPNGFMTKVISAAEWQERQKPEFKIFIRPPTLAATSDEFNSAVAGNQVAIQVDVGSRRSIAHAFVATELYDIEKICGPHLRSFEKHPDVGDFSVQQSTITHFYSDLPSIKLYPALKATKFMDDGPFEDYFSLQNKFIPSITSSKENENIEPAEEFEFPQNDDTSSEARDSDNTGSPSDDEELLSPAMLRTKFSPFGVLAWSIHQFCSIFSLPKIQKRVNDAGFIADRERFDESIKLLQSQDAKNFVDRLADLEHQHRSSHWMAEMEPVRSTSQFGMDLELLTTFFKFWATPLE